MTPRRELWLAVALCLAGSLLTIVAVSHAWGMISSDPGLTIDRHPIGRSGTAVAGGVEELGYLGVAGVLAIAATRRWGRPVTGAMLVISGLAVIVRVSRLLADGFAQGLIACNDGGDCTGGRVVHSTSSLWPALTIAGGVLMLLGGLVVAVRGRRWAALGSTYETPAARPVQAPVTDKAVWDALDEGHDPTA